MFPVLPVRDAVHFPGIIHTLLVVRDRSLRAMARAIEDDSQAISVSQRDMATDDPVVRDLCEVASLCRVLQALPMPDGSMRVVLRAEQRVRLNNPILRRGLIWAGAENFDEELDQSVEVQALARECQVLFRRLAELNDAIPIEAVQVVVAADSPTSLINLVGHHLTISPLRKQQLLETASTLDRLGLLDSILREELRIAEARQAIRARVNAEFESTQRDIILREQLRVIQSELGDDPLRAEAEEYRRRIDSAGLTAEALSRAEQEVEKLMRTPSHSPDGVAVRNYLEWLTELPWKARTEGTIDVLRASKVLEKGHFGLAAAKERILDYLAVRQISQSLRGPILCFVGPPGVGKTSLGASIAEATERHLARISLGGVRDEAEIRGHRRAYVGAAPGRIIQGLRQCGVRNPVIVLDEIDKMAMDFRGDPASALLEALDPAQNSRFVDHFIEAAFDLSEVLFIATANSVDGIPHALRDRLEVIEFESFTEEERLEIGRRHLLPGQVRNHGLSSKQIAITEAALLEVVRNYTREAGVRQLSRAIETVCRKTARILAEGSAKSVVVDVAMLVSMLGRAPHSQVDSERAGETGVATGLVVTDAGGTTMDVEAALLERNSTSPVVRLTGNLGEVLKESAETAVSFVRSVIGGLDRDVHVHLPAGSVPKDGPSAGLTIAVAVASAALERPVASGFAFTGEISLRGRVLAVGGIRDKVLAAHREGYKTIILPAENEPDLQDLPASVRNELTFIPVRSAYEALDASLGTVARR